MAAGYSDVLIGLQYGDEGKAKVVDLIADRYDAIARFNGGPNAGHTVETSRGRLALRHIPSGVFYPNMTLYIGSGCVLNLEKLVSEIEDATKLGVEFGGRFHISGQATLIQPHQIVLDSETGGKIGTTKNGIGPCYADRALRMSHNRLLNLQLAELVVDKKNAFSTMRENLRLVTKDLKVENMNFDQTLEKVEEAFEKVVQYIELDPLFLLRKVEGGAKVLFEGAQSTMLDVSRGSVPFVTSSNTVAGSAYVGGDLPPSCHRHTIGIAKALMSRVGNGPFISEIGGERSEEYCKAGDSMKYNRSAEAELDVDTLIKSEDSLEMGIALRILSGEYGTATGRPRRIGILDLVLLNHAIKQNNVDLLFLNKCDLLQEYSRTKANKIPFVTKYTKNGSTIDYMPMSNSMCNTIKPNIEYRDAFSESVSEIREISELPPTLQSLLSEIEDRTKCPILGVGVGPERSQCAARLQLLD